MQIIGRAVAVAGVLILGAAAGCDICDGADAVQGTQTMRTQEDVDAFDGGKCIVGDLIIGSDFLPAGSGDTQTRNTSIVDLSPLDDIEIVEGNVNIGANDALAFIGLPNLVFAGRRLLEPDGNGGVVRGGLFIVGNAVLTSIDLGELTDIGGCASISANPQLPASVVDDLYARVHAHAFPGSCSGKLIKASNNNGGG